MDEIRAIIPFFYSCMAQEINEYIQVSSNISRHILPFFP